MTGENAVLHKLIELFQKHPFTMQREEEFLQHCLISVCIFLYLFLLHKREQFNIAVGLELLLHRKEFFWKTWLPCEPWPVWALLSQLFPWHATWSQLGWRAQQVILHFGGNTALHCTALGWISSLLSVICKNCWCLTWPLEKAAFQRGEEVQWLERTWQQEWAWGEETNICLWSLYL